MPQDKDKDARKVRSSSVSQRMKKGDDKDSAGDAEKDAHAPPTKGKGRDKDSSGTDEGQSTLDSHLVKTVATPGEEVDLKERLNEFSEVLSKLASQEYIEEKFKEMVTAELFRTTLIDLKNELKAEIKSEIDKVNEHVSELKTRVETVETTVEDLRNKVSDMETTVETLQEENDEIKSMNAQMKEQLAEREAKIQSQSDDINNLQQYTRKNSVRIYGVDDNDAEESAEDSAVAVVKLIKTKLSLKISTADVDIAHRLGKFTKDGNRPIICKFVSRFTKYEVIKARRILKGTDIVIREDLTIQNAKLLERVSALKESVKSAWSDEGKILAQLTNGKKVVITRKTDLDRLALLSL